ncbi:MAG: hypothetical protein DME96_13325 [Verrucomicrobia bacterium]|nr:MAG: hypothetical protein DME96_13325 [Verrucomicrobiota bacterium]
MRFFDAEERSGFSTRGVLKFRQITIFRRISSFHQCRTTGDCANSELKSRPIVFLFRWHHRCSQRKHNEMKIIQPCRFLVENLLIR